jgi:hypothetical protein
MRAAVCWFLLVNVISLSLVASSMPSLRAMALADAARVPPQWLKKLLVDITFFEECPKHPPTNCNYFCAVCFRRGALCTGCLPSHPGHHAIQIRKLSGYGVVRLADMEALQLNVSDVQPYIHNGHLVMFLNKRPMSGRGRPGEIRCEECERALLDDKFRFCSMGCKVRSTWIIISVQFNSCLWHLMLHMMILVIRYELYQGSLISFVEYSIFFFADARFPFDTSLKRCLMTWTSLSHSLFHQEVTANQEAVTRTHTSQQLRRAPEKLEPAPPPSHKLLCAWLPAVPGRRGPAISVVAKTSARISDVVLLVMHELLVGP